MPEADADLEELRSAIKAAIRRDLSPRLVPDEILAAPGVLADADWKATRGPDQADPTGRRSRELVSPGAVSNPQDLDWYAAFGRSRVVPLMAAAVRAAGATGFRLTPRARALIIRA